VKYATVKLGEYTVPLLGIPQEATEEVCSKCGRTRHLTDISFDGKRFLCREGCQGSSKKKRVGKKLK
jgi:hypothetical protein